MKTKVSVFESEIQQEVLLIKSKLQDAGIEAIIENKYMSFTTTPTANTLQVKVYLEEEAKAFDIIDTWLKQQNLEDK